MTNKSQDNYSNATLDLVNKFVASNQRKRINLLAEIESESLGIFNIGYVIFEFGIAIAIAMPGNPQPEPISIYL